MLRLLSFLILVSLSLEVRVEANEDKGAIEASTFGARPDQGTDSTPAVREALNYLVGGKVLNFAPGRYDFWPDRATEKNCFISNNDPGLKRIAFLLEHRSGVTIDGHGAQFVFHGFICPFFLSGTGNITIRNLSIDYARPFDSEAKILAVTPDGADLEFSAEFPYEVRNGILTFVDHETRPNVYPPGGLLEFDAVRRETAFQVHDQGRGPAYIATEIEPGRVHLKWPGLKGSPGNILVFAAGQRSEPAIVISDSRNTILDHVTIYHAGGMGVIAQRSRDIALRHVEVKPPPSGLRMVSTTADATHFSECLGTITMTDCVFEDQMDDATNIHGIYVQIASLISPTEMEVRLVHPQQFGFDFIVPGEKLELVHGPSLMTFGEATVRSVQRLNSEYTRVTVTAPLPPLQPGSDVVGRVENNPDVVIDHCFIGKNRARGILLGSRGKIVVQNNTFHTPGAAILFEGDGRFWFEQAGVRDCTIRNNRFDDCNYGTWGTACIQVGSGIEQSARAESRYNCDITIENNTFKVFDPRILNLFSVDGLVFRDNTIVPSTDYPVMHAGAPPFDITFSDHVQLH